MEALDTLPDLVATFDPDGRLLLMNATGVELLGGVEEETLARLIFSDLYPEREAERILADALPAVFQHGRWSGRAALIGPDGRRLECEQHLIAHQLHDGKARSFTLVASRHDAHAGPEPELRNRRESLVAMSMGIVHDLNNILGPIAAYTDLAASSLPSSGPAHGYLEQIRKASDRALELSERLGKLVRGHKPNRTTVDMRGLVREVIGWLRVSRPDLMLAIESKSTKATVSGDPVQLLQAVMNLCLNAVESLSDRSGSVTCTINHVLVGEAAATGLSAGPYVQLVIRDNGRGIEEEIKKRIFDPFFSTKLDGSGLGLTVSREIVKDHGGTITVEAEPDRGTRISLYLPASSTLQQE